MSANAKDPELTTRPIRPAKHETSFVESAELLEVRWRR